MLSLGENGVCFTEKHYGVPDWLTQELPSLPEWEPNPQLEQLPANANLSQQSHSQCTDCEQEINPCSFTVFGARVLHKIIVARAD